jgi:DNA polymerase-3 subunit epsilon
LLTNLVLLYLEYMYAIVDIETTGGYASANGITEIAIYVHDGNRVTQKFETLINPLQPIPRYIASLTGITDEMVRTAPTFNEVALDVFKILENNIFVAHNVNFDYSFVNHHLRVSGFVLSPKKLCTVRLSRKVIEGLPSYSLGNLCRTLEIPVTDRHRAGGDAKATVLLFEHLLRKGANETIQQMLRKASSEQWLPLHLQKKDIDTLPTHPGVYYFHDIKGKIIYVGKAVNIRKRVSSHFTVNDAERKRQNFVREVCKITYQSCSTELEALVLESTEIKRIWPKYNKSQKQPQQKFGLYMFEDNKGYHRLAIDKKKKNIQSLYDFNLWHEGNTMLRKITEEFNLNKALCFLENSTTNNWNDTPQEHNQKVQNVMQALEQRLPTFVVIEDKKSTNEKLCILVERGCFWGMGYLTRKFKISTSMDLKNHLKPFADNDFIRTSIFSYVEQNPDKRVFIPLK